MKYSEGIEFDGEWNEGKRGSKGVFKLSSMGTSFLSFLEEDFKVEVIEEFESL